MNALKNKNKIFKTLLCTTTLLNVLLAISAPEIPVREAVTGKVSVQGVTFATEENAREAIARGHFDQRNPFVEDVYLLRISTETLIKVSTITQVAKPGIFLCCKHTVLGLLSLMSKCGKCSATIEKDKETVWRVNMLDSILHDYHDVALIKLQTADDHVFPKQSEFVPVAEPMEGIPPNGFVIPYTNVFIADTQKDLGFWKAVSIHPLRKKAERIISTLTGNIPTDEIWNLDVCRRNAGFRINTNDFIGVTCKSKIRFPETSQKPSLRLVSTLGNGCSGAPLIIRQDDQYKLYGMHTSGGIAPCAIDPVVGTYDPTLVTYVNIFVDLPALKHWIEKAVAKLSAPSEG